MELKIFKNKEFGEVRSMMINSEPWFVGKDVAEALGYSNSRKAISDHVDEEDKGVTIRDTLGGDQSITILNESGLYALILSSKLPKAKVFKRWITSEVLPSIRKTGSYSISKRQPSLSEVVRFLSLIKEVMVDQNCPDRSVAITMRHLCQQLDIDLPEEFIKFTNLEERFLQFLYTNELASGISSGDAVQVFLGRKLREIPEQDYQRLKSIYHETSLKEGWE